MQVIFFDPLLDSRNCERVDVDGLPQCQWVGPSIVSEPILALYFCPSTRQPHLGARGHVTGEGWTAGGRPMDLQERNGRFGDGRNEEEEGEREVEAPPAPHLSEIESSLATWQRRQRGGGERG